MDEEILLGLYPGYTSVLGPYYRPDGRQHVVLNNSNVPKGTKGKTRTISYPKALKEIELKQRLKNDETVDHEDRDFTNDNLSNLVVKPRGQHASEDALRVEYESVECFGCGKEFIPTRYQADERNKNKAGPFCSRRCSGRYSANVKTTDVNVIRDPIVKHYDKSEK